MLPVSLWARLTPENSKLVEVTWRDIHSEPDWEDQGIQGPKRRFRSWGFLVYAGDDPVEPGQTITVIASTYDDETRQWKDFTSFPYGVVVGVRVLRKPRR